MTKSLPPPPPSREEILSAAGPQRALIYHTVRRILDDFEEVARWEVLYYPPTEVGEFLRLQTGLVALIEDIPYRVSEMSVSILCDAFKALLGDPSQTLLDLETRQMILGLLEPDAARMVTRSTQRIAMEAIDSFPETVLAEPQKPLLKWMIARHSQESATELSERAFDAAVGAFPKRILDDSMQQILSNMQFYFDGIHAMTGGDLEKLQARIEFFQTAAAANLSAQERVFTCEISADLKGKYTSAIMGAAANLVAEGYWNGADIEPVLFPEKADEFARNELLVKTLVEVIESIKRLPEEVPLIDLVARWEIGQRVDRYALPHLFGFLGNLGKLMKESSRRALYSGDYHQIQLREHRLSNRINELNMLHNSSWDVIKEDDASVADGYPQMVDKAVELAAILDVELLKKLIGDEAVKLLLHVVSIEGLKRKELEVRLGHEQEKDYSTEASSALRKKLPERQQTLIPLLYDEDLQTFLELLLGSVMKRASFSLKRREATPAATAPEPAAATVVAPAVAPEEVIESVGFEELSLPGLDALSEPERVPPPGVAPSESPDPPQLQAIPDEASEKLAMTEKLRGSLRRLASSSNPDRKSFDLVHRLLSNKGMIPPSMLQSILPFLEGLTDALVPQMAALSAKGELSITFQSDLMQYCRDLSRRDLTPREMKNEVLTNMDGLLRLLSDIDAAMVELVDAYAPAGESPDSEDYSDDFLTPIE